MGNEPAPGISVIIPTYNGAKYMDALLNKLHDQTLPPDEIIIVDSSSNDGTLEAAAASGVKIKTMTVKKEEFDHGGTRTMAGIESKGEIIIYLTQDALPYDRNTIKNIVRPFLENTAVGAVYGRQVPYPGESPFAAHSRYFIYPENSFLRTYEDRHKYRIKTAFLSNAFSAYRRKAMEKTGFFKSDLISTEDTYAGARILLEGYILAYASDAVVLHSHNYTVLQEFKRYFDIGVFHSRESWIVEKFGSAGGEGLSYLRSEFSYLLKTGNIHLIPAFLLRNGMKISGYRLGRLHRFLPKRLILKLSMHKGWWLKT